MCSWEEVGLNPHGPRRSAVLQVSIAAFLLAGLGAGLLGPRAGAPEATHEAGALQAAAAPSLSNCTIRPDPTQAVWKACGADNADAPAYAGAPVEIRVDVADADGGNVTVSFYFDYVSLNASGNETFNPASVVINATTSGLGPTTVVANWTYAGLHPDFPIVANKSSYYYVFIEVRDAANETMNTTGPSHPYDIPLVVALNAAPVVHRPTCVFRPDPRVPDLKACGEDNTNLPLYLNVTAEFTLNVSDEEGQNISVWFYFDYFYFDFLNGTFVFNPVSLIVNVTPNGPANTTVTVNWSYPILNPNFPDLPGVTARYWVFIEARDTLNATSTWPYPEFPFGFPVLVKKNSEPFIDGLSSSYGVATPISFPNPQVPPFNLTVTVRDADSDNVTVTWFWGDGSYTVYPVDVVNGSTDLNVSHGYPLDAFPLNETGRDVIFPFTIWTDDTIPGHNTTQTSTAIFRQAIDWFPNVVIRSPVLGTLWKVGDVIELNGTASDPEGDPMTYFWDTDVSVDTSGDADSGNDADRLGSLNATSYGAPGNYSLRLWATDGADKKFCFNDDCSVSIPHWRNQTYGIQVRANSRPNLVVEPEYVVEGYKPALFRIVVSDPDGDGMTVTWDWGDGTVDTTFVNATRGPGEPIGTPVVWDVFGAHTFLRLNSTQVNISVSDGDLANETSTIAFVWSVNAAPSVFSFATYRANGTLIQNNTVVIGEDFILEVNVTDGSTIDGGVLDDLYVVIAWADGTFNATNVSAVGGAYPSLRFVHNYTEGGEFSIRILVTDGLGFLLRTGDGPGNYTYDERSHVVSQAGPTVSVPRAYAYTGVGPWDWWDNVTLGLVLGIPGFFSVRAAWRYRQERKKEEEG